ncbi:uncharacterized protein NESG_00009 [Nematocida ausubeli]|uniref:Uncharacterized protein n=1 Tax=Nematocida ausubeli (strain ATCC PRA-371 / ERTm2) TaxID=1913371 RepID=A0A086J472_NEMA1|nr:uncharacterized protein NESG_00009 [Nematocida ausubeli]KFG26940.1 hypothetical protein NESG_00009 [Nematocida ausubeli]
MNLRRTTHSKTIFTLLAWLSFLAGVGLCTEQTAPLQKEAAQSILRRILELPKESNSAKEIKGVCEKNMLLSHSESISSNASTAEWDAYISHTEAGLHSSAINTSPECFESIHTIDGVRIDALVNEVLISGEQLQGGPYYKDPVNQDFNGSISGNRSNYGMQMEMLMNKKSSLDSKNLIYQEKSIDLSNTHLSTRQTILMHIKESLRNTGVEETIKNYYKYKKNLSLPAGMYQEYDKIAEDVKDLTKALRNLQSLRICSVSTIKEEILKAKIINSSTYVSRENYISVLSMLIEIQKMYCDLLNKDIEYVNCLSNKEGILHALRTKEAEESRKKEQTQELSALDAVIAAHAARIQYYEKYIERLVAIQSSFKDCQIRTGEMLGAYIDLYIATCVYEAQVNYVSMVGHELSRTEAQFDMSHAIAALNSSLGLT